MERTRHHIPRWWAMVILFVGLGAFWVYLVFGAFPGSRRGVSARFKGAA